MEKKRAREVRTRGQRRVLQPFKGTCLLAVELNSEQALNFEYCMICKYLEKTIMPLCQELSSPVHNPANEHFICPTLKSYTTV